MLSLLPVESAPLEPGFTGLLSAGNEERERQAAPTGVEVPGMYVQVCGGGAGGGTKMNAGMKSMIAIAKNERIRFFKLYPYRLLARFRDRRNRMAMSGIR